MQSRYRCSNTASRRNGDRYIGRIYRTGPGTLRSVGSGAETLLGEITVKGLRLRSNRRVARRGLFVPKPSRSVRCQRCGMPELGTIVRRVRCRPLLATDVVTQLVTRFRSGFCLTIWMQTRHDGRDDAAVCAAMAQVHATIALAAATALGRRDVDNRACPGATPPELSTSWLCGSTRSIRDYLDD